MWKREDPVGEDGVLSIALVGRYVFLMLVLVAVASILVA
jgi:hypothetical protein